MRYTCFLAALLVTSQPAFAEQSWNESVQRGLVIYDFAADNGSVTLVCDPDRLHGSTSNASLRVQMTGLRGSAQFVVLSSTGEQAAFTLTDGFVTEAAADAEEWSQMVGFLRDGGSIAFVTSKSNIQITDILPLTDISC